MGIQGLKKGKTWNADRTIIEIREKLGLTQAELAGLLGISRSYLTLVESKKRNLDQASGSLLTNIFLQFLELEKGIQSDYRSLETRLFLNEAYRKALPVMNSLEKEHRREIKRLEKEMDKMKTAARNAEHSIIVFTTLVKQQVEKDPQTVKPGRMITGLELFKQKAYQRLLFCFEPEQAKLQARIEALAGEAKALRRFRTAINKTQQPFKESLPKTVKRKDKNQE